MTPDPQDFSPPPSGGLGAIGSASDHSSPSPLIRLRGISKSFGSNSVLEDVNLDVGRGVTGLLGPNGAGKSTLIKIVLGLLQATRGTGEILGHELGREALAIRARVGFMPEDDCYVDGLSGIEMIAFAARLSGLGGVESLQRGHEILDFCGVEQERYRPVNTYSTGMRQKLKFAQSIVHDPPLLILDEPTAGLDPEERRAMLQRIQILSKKTHMSIWISTHILPDIQELSDQVVIIAGGRVKLSESMAVLDRPISPSYEVQTIGEPGPLRVALEADGMQVSSSGPDSITVVHTDLDMKRLPPKIWAAATEQSIPIRQLIPARNSLEQIFLQAIQEHPDADS